jgi:predicted dehydrogenase
MKKIRLGIIGTGIIVNEAHAPALKRLTDRFEVTALCNRSRAKAESLARDLGVNDKNIWQDWQEFLTDAPVDAVLLALPIELNYPVSRAAAAAGKHVLCEKPVGQNMDEARGAVGLPAEFGVTFMVAEDIEFVPQFAKAAELVADGEIGKPTLIQWNVFNFMAMSNKYAQTRWRTEHVFPGGYVMDGGVHFVHVLQMLAGPIESVKAETRTLDPRLGKVDSAFALLTHGSGILSSLNMSWQTQMPQPTPLLVFGEKASLSVSEEKILRTDNESGDVREIAFEREDDYYLQFIEFHEAVTGNRPPSVSTESCAHDVEVILAILEAARRGESVSL